MEACIGYGVDHVGLNFVPGSPRFVEIDKAVEIAEMARGRVQVVGVFRNQSPANIIEIARRVRLDAVQLHGDESPKICAELPYPVWKAFGVWLGWDPSVLSRYKGLAVRLFDTSAGGQSGGTGKPFDWSLIPSRVSRPWYLAGGLGLENIAAALDACQPDGIDLNSGLETSPGVKSPEMIEQMMRLLTTWRGTAAAPKPGQAGPTEVIDGLTWPVWQLAVRRPPGDQEALWVLELLQAHGGRLVIDARLREGDPSEIVSNLMSLQMAARGRGGRIKFRLSDDAMQAILSASLATVLEIVD